MSQPSEALILEFPPDAAGRALTDFPFVERAGLELLHVERGRAVLRLPFDPNINHVGMVYAGALFTVAEVPGGVLFAAAFDLARFYPIVGEVNIRFSKPARSAVTVDARMTDAEMERVASALEETGKAKWILEQEIVDTAGVVVAMASATYFGLAY